MEIEWASLIRGLKDVGDVGEEPVIEQIAEEPPGEATL